MLSEHDTIKCEHCGKSWIKPCFPNHAATALPARAAKPTFVKGAVTRLLLRVETHETEE